MEPIKVRFGVILAPGKAEIHEGILPKIGPEEILLKMEVCNICTEDYQRWEGLRKFNSPMADGHEYIGKIIAKGRDVIDYYQIGDRVGKLNQQCGVCNDCRIGNTGDCQYAIPKAIGLDEYYGMKGFATYKIMPQRLAIKISNDIKAAEAAFLEPLATVIQGIKRIGIQPMENVVVIGVGTMGLLNAQVAKAFGANTIMTDISNKKINRARAMNIGHVINSGKTDPIKEVLKITNGVGADAVILAVGNSVAYKQGYAMLKQYKGRMLFFSAGYPEPKFDFSSNDVHYRKTELVGTINADNADFIMASKMLSNRLINVSQCLEGKTFPLNRYADALKAATTPDSYRISVDLSE